MMRCASFQSASIRREPCLKGLLRPPAVYEPFQPPHLVWCSPSWAAWPLAQQDKYTLKVPGGLAFSEFRGYEGWQTVAISQNDKLVAVILANPVMIDAYLAGIPGNGKPFPDGAKMAKIHWSPKKNQYFPDTTVPGTQHDVDFMVKDSTEVRG